MGVVETKIGDWVSGGIGVELAGAVESPVSMVESIKPPNTNIKDNKAKTVPRRN